MVLIGAFNNEWSLRLTRELRYSLALDVDRHLIYIKDPKAPRPGDGVGPPIVQPTIRVGRVHPTLQDYALISRIRNSEAGHAVVVIGGLYTYGTEAVDEFLTDPQPMRSIEKEVPCQSRTATCRSPWERQ